MHSKCFQLPYISAVISVQLSLELLTVLIKISVNFGNISAYGVQDVFKTGPKLKKEKKELLTLGCMYMSQYLRF